MYIENYSYAQLWWFKKGTCSLQLSFLWSLRLGRRLIVPCGQVNLFCNRSCQPGWLSGRGPD